MVLFSLSLAIYNVRNVILTLVMSLWTLSCLDKSGFEPQCYFSENIQTQKKG